jgi:ABC-type nitrate/sulfonate/bicarbonate transport system substrate-binding protein
VLQRFQSLLKKEHDATLLLSPFEVEAQARGFNVVASASKVLGAYQGLVAGARKSWADANRDTVVGYIRAYAEAVEWLYERSNKDEAIAILRKNLPSMTAQGGETAYTVMLAPGTGMHRKAQMDMRGVETVLRLRSKYGQPQKTLADPKRYYDDSFYRAAMR